MKPAGKERASRPIVTSPSDGFPTQVSGRIEKLRATKAIAVATWASEVERGHCGTPGCTDPDCAFSYGECHCGCGGRTPTAHQSSRKHGWVIREPMLFIRWHHLRTPEAQARRTPPAPPGHLTPAAAAAKYGLSNSQLCKAIDSGLVAGQRVTAGRRIRRSVDELALIEHLQEARVCEHDGCSELAGPLSRGCIGAHASAIATRGTKRSGEICRRIAIGKRGHERPDVRDRTAAMHADPVLADAWWASLAEGRKAWSPFKPGSYGRRKLMRVRAPEKKGEAAAREAIAHALGFAQKYPALAARSDRLARTALIDHVILKREGQGPLFVDGIRRASDDPVYEAARKRAKRALEHGYKLLVSPELASLLGARLHPAKNRRL